MKRYLIAAAITVAAVSTFAETPAIARPAPVPDCSDDDDGEEELNRYADGTDERRCKNNNGYGNGPESGPAPGHSFPHNPQLRPDQNSGPRSGPRGDNLR